MKTKWYEYLRESTDPLWKGYVDQLGILNTYHQNHLKFMMNQGSAFIHFVLDLQLNGPLYKTFGIPAQDIHQESCCLQVQSHSHEIVCGQLPAAVAQAFDKKIREQLPQWEQTPRAYTPFQYLLELNANRVLGMLGFYIYDSEIAAYRLFGFTLHFPEPFSYESQVHYQKLATAAKLVATAKEDEASKQEFSPFPKTEPKTSGLTFLKTPLYQLTKVDQANQFLLKNIPQKTLAQYHTHQKLLKGLQLRVFSDYPSQTIAEASGYANLNTFYVAFKNHFGMSPSEVQKRRPFSL